VDIGDLIRDGHLARIRQRSVKVLDLSLAKVDRGDFTDASLERILIEEKHLHGVVKPTLDLHKGRPTLVFATSVKHAEALAGCSTS
jgi:superfamily II DNA or RNA helicase